MAFSTAVKKIRSYASGAPTNAHEGIFLVRGKDSTGHSAWFYVSIALEKRAGFKKLSGCERLDLAEYGTVIESGYGDSPPMHIRARMKDEYGFVS